MGGMGAASREPDHFKNAEKTNKSWGGENTKIIQLHKHLNAE